MYARSNKEAVHRRYDRLAKDGAKAWLDQEKHCVARIGNTKSVKQFTVVR